MVLSSVALQTGTLVCAQDSAAWSHQVRVHVPTHVEVWHQV